MARQFALPNIENDATPSSVGTPLLVFGRERVTSQQHGLVSDFTSAFGPNTNTSSTREPVVSRKPKLIPHFTLSSPGGGGTSLWVRRGCAPVLGSFWPENSGIGVSF